MNKTILCVDDESEILDLFSEEFEDQGYKVLRAGSGVEGFDVFNANDVDCIISDIRMPNGDGVEFVKNLKAAGVVVPIFILTGFSDYSSEELQELGVSAIIFKPFDMDEVVQMIESHLK